MPSYRGVDKKNIVDSVRRAAAFLTRLNLGPVTDRTIARVLSQSRVDMLDRARTDSELQQVINETNIPTALTMFMKVLRFHALTDRPGTGGRESEALSIYRKLHSWGAFPPGDLAVTSMMEPEFRAHLLPAYLRVLAGMDDAGDVAAQKRFEDFISGVREAEAEAGEKGEKSRWLADSVPLIVNLAKIGGMENEIRDILDANPKASPIVPGALETMLDMNARENALGVEPAIRPYRLALGKLPENEDERETLVMQALQRVQNIMQKHLNHDEMLNKVATDTNLQTGEVYIVIFATKSAARYLAERGDYTIFDQSGNRLPGISSGPGSGPHPAP